MTTPSADCGHVFHPTAEAPKRQRGWAGDQLRRSVTGESFTYDANGTIRALTVSDDNIVTKMARTAMFTTRKPADHTYSRQWNGNDYEWDHRGRLVKVEETLANSSHRWEPQPEPSLRSATIPLDRRIGKFVQFLEWRNDACFNCWQPNPEIECYVQPAGGQSSITSTMASIHRSNYARSPTKARRPPMFTPNHARSTIDEVLAEETVWGTSWALADHLARSTTGSTQRLAQSRTTFTPLSVAS